MGMMMLLMLVMLLVMLLWRLVIRGRLVIWGRLVIRGRLALGRVREGVTMVGWWQWNRVMLGTTILRGWRVANRWRL